MPALVTTMSHQRLQSIGAVRVGRWSSRGEAFAGRAQHPQTSMAIWISVVIMILKVIVDTMKRFLEENPQIDVDPPQEINRSKYGKQPNAWLRLHRLTSLRLHDTLAIPLDCQRFFLSSAISRRFRGGDCAVVGEIPLDFLDAGTKRSGRGTPRWQRLRTSRVVSWVGKVFLYFTWFGKKDEWLCDFI